MDGRRTSKESQEVKKFYRNARYYRKKLYEAEMEEQRLKAEEERELRLEREKLTNEELLREVNYGKYICTALFII